MNYGNHGILVGGVSLMMQPEVVNKAEQVFYDTLRTAGFTKDIKNKFIENYLTLKNGRPGALAEKQFAGRLDREFASHWKQECENSSQSLVLPAQLTLQSPLLLNCWAPVLPWSIA